MRLVLTFALLTASALPQQPRMLDRVVAVVNRQVITQEDWQQEQLFTALLEGRKPAEAALTRDSLDRLIDATLLRQQVEDSGFAEVNASGLAAEVERIRRQVAGEVSEESWQGLLADYDLTPADFSVRIGRQMQQLAFVSARFSPAIRIPGDSIAQYYEKVFLPEFKARAGDSAPPSLASLSNRIREILAEQRTNEMMVSWLHSLRSQAAVRVLIDTASLTAQVANGH